MLRKKQGLSDDQMGAVVKGMCGKRLRYSDLIAPNGMPSWVRGSE